MFPCPHTSSFLALNKIAILIFTDVDKGNISLIYFWLFIHHGKDSLRTCKSHDDRVKLLRYLHERLGEALRKL